VVSNKFFRAPQLNVRRSNISPNKIANTGVNPFTGEYLSAGERKLLFKKRNISSEGVFKKPGALLKITPSTITPNDNISRKSGALVKTKSSDENIVKSLEKRFSVLEKTVYSISKALDNKSDNKILSKRVSILENDVSFLAKTINKEAELEKKAQKQYEKDVEKQEEKKLRSGEEKKLEKKITKGLISPVKAVGKKAGGVLGTLMELFMTLLGGWLTNLGIEAIKADAEGNIGKLEKIKEEVIKTLAIVGGIFLALNVGILGIIGTIGKITLAILAAPFKFVFNRIRDFFNRAKKPPVPTGKKPPTGGSKPGPGGTKPGPKGGPKGGSGGTGSRVTGKPNAPKVPIDSANDAARKKLAKEILDKRLSAKGTKIGGKYVSMTAKEAGELLKKPPGGLAGIISRAWNGVKGFASKAPGRAIGGLKATFGLAGKLPGAFGGSARAIGKALGVFGGIVGKVGPGLLKFVGNIAKKSLGVLNVLLTGKEVVERLGQGMSPAKALLPVLVRLGVSSAGGALGGAIGSVLPIAGTGLGYLAGSGLGYWLGDWFKGLLDENWSQEWENAPGIKDINGFLGFDSKKSPSPAATGATGASVPTETPAANTSGGTDSNPSLVKPSAQIASPSSPSMSVPGPVSGGGNTTVIYKKVGGSGGQMQGQPLKSGSATDVPLIASADPSNFYTMYSQLLYNVVG
jgi:hypothetical protein